MSNNAAVSGARCIESGFAFEEQFAAEAKRRGFLVYRARSPLSRYDFVVRGLKVQCKNKSTMNSLLNISFKRRYSVGEFDVLALNFCERLLLIPASRLRSHGNLLRTSINPFSFLRFENNWKIFDAGELVGSVEPRQLPLFEGDA